MIHLLVSGLGEFVCVHKPTVEALNTDSLYLPRRATSISNTQKLYELPNPERKKGGGWERNNCQNKETQGKAKHANTPTLLEPKVATQKIRWPPIVTVE